MIMAKNSTPTIAAIATPPGVGAIAVIRISGPRAFEISDQVFTSRKGKLENATSHTAYFGVIRANGQLIDEVIAVIFRGPSSFTGDDTVEFSCHGSTYIQKEILNVLIQHGSQPAKPGEFTMRAFLNRKMDLAQAEAVGDLIASDSASSHRVALKQMRGGFSKEIQMLREKLIHFASLLELELDFSEEDVEFADRKQLISLISETIQHTKKLSESFETGNVIKRGIPVAIAGKPNVGKSTLLNLILNEDRAIVSDIAGTTRDTIEEEINLGGMKFRFIDTAGIRKSDDLVEQIGVEKTLEKIKEASVIIYLFDPGETGPDELQILLNTIIASRPGEKYVLVPVANKSDRYNKSYLQDLFSPIPDVIFISAKEHSGINELFKRITSVISESKIDSGDVILTNARHKDSIDKTTAALENSLTGLSSGLATDLIAIEIRSSLMYLGEITGQITTDDLLGKIFSKFCIGK
ncbi:MAG: tRNA uridine-5-carboxymethylaminomethyl(34) synthesis GTPase MnmE [Bacteroidetes bacterium]|nr:tRNA uridine-5-carboxymethylaminomethyl(34) synthesis GTPase MnmE [Bacteroidota bacterium]